MNKLAKIITPLLFTLTLSNCTYNYFQPSINNKRPANSITSKILGYKRFIDCNTGDFDKCIFGYVPKEYQNNINSPSTQYQIANYASPNLEVLATLSLLAMAYKRRKEDKDSFK